VGAEALGFAGPDADAEVILLCQRLWDDLGLPGVQLEINSLGQPHERRAHREALIAYLEAHADQLDEEARRRLHSNPLRILDTKNPAMQALVEAAPKLIGFLGEESLAHFDRLQALLRAQNVPYRINPRLVRGLDYYNLTVFEWVVDGLTVCGGGRYDPLVEMLGGRPSPACGFALGVERVIELMRRADPDATDSLCDVYVVHQGAQAEIAAFQAAERLRDTGLDVVMHCGGGSFKSQFRRADASGAFAAVVLGEDEVAAGEATVKWLRGDEGAAGAGQQQRVPMERLAEVIVGFVQDEG
jgi:histidyl-tRNA synthetase